MSNQSFAYYQFRLNQRSTSIELVFPQWEGPREKVVIISPHDDDAILGAGYLIEAVLANQGDVYVIIVCDGSAGYSNSDQKGEIVAIRKAETESAFREIGVLPQHIIRLDYPDFSAFGHLGWHLINGQEGSFASTIRQLRGLGATRLVLPNGYREHIDHEAAYKIGAFDGPQVGDPILVDWGQPQRIKSYLIYAVWGDFSPEAALLHGTRMDIRANFGIKVNNEAEMKISKALRKWESQLQIIDGILKAREARKCKDGYIEGYLGFDPRPSLDYSPYAKLVDSIDSCQTPG